MRCTRIIEWDMGHRLLGHEGKCRTLHGHRYKAEVTCEADALDSVGRVVDFGVIKQRIGGFVDELWDHRTMLHNDDPLVDVLAADSHERGTLLPYTLIDANPTAENIAAALLKLCPKLMEGTGVKVVHIRLWETPNAYVDVSA